MAETNEQGQVALKYYQPQNKYIRVGGEKRNFREYMFTVGRAGLSMAWVEPQDVETLMAMLGGGCCGNSSGHIFKYANARDVAIWTNKV